ncbi:MAG: O-methyltransferase [Bdellovibrionaceae bacterium]|nr:O-methyltransferase [Pseudobdellovibrionaceae bacterium]
MDRKFVNPFQTEDDLLRKSREAARGLGLEQISLGMDEAKTLAMFLRLHGARRVVEIGTLTGTSGIYILRAMGKGGALYCLEKEPEYAEIAEPLLRQAAQAVGAEVRVVVGDATETLKKISAEGPFDAVFIDANKAAYLHYLDWAESHLRRGGLLIADNVFLKGAVFGESTGFSEKQVKVMREFNLRIADAQRYYTCFVPTGEGLAVAIKEF